MHLKFALLFMMQLFRKLTRDVRSYVQKVFPVSSFLYMLEMLRSTLCVAIYSCFSTPSVCR